MLHIEYSGYWHGMMTRRLTATIFYIALAGEEDTPRTVILDFIFFVTSYL